MVFRPVVVVVACLALLMPVSASTVEELTAHAVAYQFDGDGHHDAPDSCGASSAEWSLPVDATTDGMLAPPDDVADVYVVAIPRSLVGTRLTVDVAERTGAEDLGLDAFAPDCQGSVLEAVNWPHADPTPPQPEPGQQQVAAGNPQEPTYCDPDQWIFAIDGLQGLREPASIHVAWTDGSEHPVPLAYRWGAYAFYASDENLGILVKGAWANLPAGWIGAFRLAVGPCDAVDGGAVYGLPPVLEDGVLTFTPIRAGPHIVQVTVADGLVRPITPPAHFDPTPYLPVEIDETVAGILAFVHGLTHDPTHPDFSLLPSFMVPTSCHYCIGQAEQVVKEISYRLTARAN
jgi:hypothetical protein